MFYHRCSRGVQQHRRLCIEPITIRPDGTIDEVKMTSQGPGEPFGPGEKIYGYQACGLKGTAYIGLDERYEEKLTNISAGDEAVFRYVKSEEGWKEISLVCAGKGKIQILMNGAEAGCAAVSGEKGALCSVSAVLHAPAGEYELMLKFQESDGLEVMELVLN